MNCLSCLLSELFLTHTVGAPQGVPQVPQGCSPLRLFPQEDEQALSFHMSTTNPHNLAECMCQ